MTGKRGQSAYYHARDDAGDECPNCGAAFVKEWCNRCGWRADSDEGGDER